MPSKGTRHDAKALGPGGSIARGSRYGKSKRKKLEEQVRQLRAALFETSPAEIVALREGGLLSKSVEFYVAVAAGEIVRLRRAVEGEPVPDADGTLHPPHPLSAQRISRLGRAQRLLTLGLALEARALLNDDRESASTAGTLIAKADLILVATLGLDPPEHAVPDLATYVAAQDRAQRENGDAADAEVVPAENTRDNGSGSPDSRVVTPEARDDGDGAVEGCRDSARSRTAANATEGGEPC
ncbi:MAG: hypothetical protein IH884_02440 [Myxococcales bacterium]|nr:hypothetical protein [Myxococcales bacterium]